MSPNRTGKKSNENSVAKTGDGEWRVPVVVGVVTFVVFAWVLQNGFVSWDDDRNFLENENYRGLGWTQLYWMFTTFHKGHYQPLSWVTLGVDYLLWGMEPYGYHLTNLLLHTANAVLFYFVVVRLLQLGSSNLSLADALSIRRAAGFAALVWSIHPLRVESVAWVTQRRDVLSGLFLLLTILCYLRATASFRETRNYRLMFVALITYGMSLLSKATGITLPVVLLILDVHPLRRLSWVKRGWLAPSAQQVWREKFVFLLLAVPCAIAALIAQDEAGALKPLERYGLAARLAQASFGSVFYLWRTVLPINLSPLYELPANLDPWNWAFVLSGLIVVVISVGLLLVRGCWPAGLVVWICYLVILAPTLGVAQSGVQLVADRYSYVSCMGWAALAGAGLMYSRVLLSDRGPPQILFSGLAVTAVIVLAVLTSKQVRIWHDSESLWRHVLAVDPNSSIGHNSLGVVLASRREFKEAIIHYHKALEIDPVYAKAHNNLANALTLQGALESAIEHYNQALQIEPNYAKAHYNLASTLARQGNLSRAIEHYRRAVEIDRFYLKAHYNLGIALAKRGELDAAIEHFRRAVEIQPQFAEAHVSLGRALAERGKKDEAVQHFQEGLRILRSEPRTVDLREPDLQ